VCSAFAPHGSLSSLSSPPDRSAVRVGATATPLRSPFLHYLRSSNTFQRDQNGHNFFIFEFYAITMADSCSAHRDASIELLYDFIKILKIFDPKGGPFTFIGKSLLMAITCPKVIASKNFSYFHTQLDEAK
jgi:hypothetical protein